MTTDFKKLLVYINNLIRNFYTKAEIDAMPSGGASINDITPSGSTVYSSEKVESLIPEIPTIPTQLSQLSEDTTHRVVTDAEKTTWNAKLSSETSHADVLVDGDIGVTVQGYNADLLTSLAQRWREIGFEDAWGYPTYRFIELLGEVDDFPDAIPSASDNAGDFLFIRVKTKGDGNLFFSSGLYEDVVFTAVGQLVLLVSDGGRWIVAFKYGFQNINDTAYDATTWNNNLDAPTKNALRDKFESLVLTDNNFTNALKTKLDNINFMQIII